MKARTYLQVRSDRSVLKGAGARCGIVFYAFDKQFKHWHGIWHLFVVAGSAIHYFAILLYVL
jgi:channel protein (hemolysin III family)